jgi:hypothetical protein
MSATYAYRHESRGVINASPDVVFEHLDDHTRLSAHMSKPSWKMGWGRMAIEFDGANGRAIGSRIRLAGRVFGIRLELEETVTERAPPRRKVWETVGTPRLLVIGSYRMGFELSPAGERTAMRMFIEYSLQQAGFARILGTLFGASYAAWCTRKMVDDVTRHFGSPTSGN